MYAPRSVHQQAAQSVRAEIGYGHPLGKRLVGTPVLGARTHAYGRDYQLGYRLAAAERAALQSGFDLTATRSENAMRPAPDTG